MSPKGEIAPSRVTPSNSGPKR